MKAKNTSDQTTTTTNSPDGGQTTKYYYKKVEQDKTLITGLKEEFSAKDTGSGQEGQKFKKLCEDQMENETQSAPEVNKPTVRICYADDFIPDSSSGGKSRTNPKGHLWSGENSDTTDSSKKGYRGFKDGPGNGSNLFLLEDYGNKNKDQDPLEKFASGYNSAELIETDPESDDGVEKKQKLKDLLEEK